MATSHGKSRILEITWAAYLGSPMQGSTEEHEYKSSPESCCRGTGYDNNLISTSSSHNLSKITALLPVAAHTSEARDGPRQGHRLKGVPRHQEQLGPKMCAGTLAPGSDVALCVVIMCTVPALCRGAIEDAKSHIPDTT